MISYLKKFLLGALFLSFFCENIFAQQTPLLDSLLKKIEWQHKQKATSVLFTHFDKNVYSPSETVWFTTYVLNPLTAISNYQTFTVALVRNDDKKVLQNEEYVLQNGIGKGSLVLSDTLKPGAYSLVVLTNVLKNNQTDDVFTQAITIKPSSNANIKIILSPIDNFINTDSTKVKVKVVTNSVSPIAQQQVNFSFGTGNAAYFGKVITDTMGEAIIALRTASITTDKSLLKVTVTKGFDFRESFIQLPKFSETVTVNFYPEGGSAIEGLSSIIGIETRDAFGTPVSIKGLLLEDGKEIAKISTNEIGLGSFFMKMDAGKKYAFKVDDKDYATSKEFLLPTALNRGCALQIKNAIVNDTLDVMVQGNLLDQKLTLMLHNYENIYSSIDFVLRKNSRKLRFPLAEIPRGLVTVSLLDSTGKPWSERLVFAHFDKKVKVTIIPNEKNVEQRGKVTIKVKIEDEAGNPQRGYFSFACVQDNKVESLKLNDLDSYYNLGTHLSSTTLGLAEAYSNNNIVKLENVLLVKGWRKYKWQNLATVTAQDTIATIASMKFVAVIKSNNTKNTGINKIQVLKEEGFELVQGQSNRVEILPQLLHTFGKKLVINAIDNLNGNVPLEYENPFKTYIVKNVNSRLLLGSDFSYFTFKKQPIVKIDLEQAIKQLDEVIVTSFVRCVRPSERNSCGDYVCKNGALNCTIHTTCGTPAISGQKYYMSVGNSYGLNVYNCFGGAKISGNNVLVTKGINLEKTFYGANYQIDGKDEQIFLSTLHWNGGIITDEKGITEVVFNVSDLTGKFRCLINGITATSRFSSDSFFNVVKTIKD